MIWSEIPERDGAPADVVLGQKDFYTEGPACGTGDFRHGLHLPTGVLVAEGKLLVADAWHHRILVWNQVPTVSNLPPDAVIGQVDASHVLPNRGAGPTAKSLNWPYGMAYIAGRFYVADTGNRRVLGWKGIPNGIQKRTWSWGNLMQTLLMKIVEGPSEAIPFDGPMRLPVMRTACGSRTLATIECWDGEGIQRQTVRAILYWDKSRCRRLVNGLTISKERIAFVFRMG